MTAIKVEREIGDKVLSIETGLLAKQAAGAVMVRYGDTVVLVAVAFEKAGQTVRDFFPLTVDYREKTSAAGKFPGGFIKREGRPTSKEILTMRMIDRPTRPLFPDNYRDEVQIMAMVLSADQQNDPDILAMIGASAALSVSPVPFDGPIGSVRVARVDDKFVINPTHEQLDSTTMDMILAGKEEAINMIELGSQEVSEELVVEAVKFGHSAVKQIVQMIKELAEKVGVEKIEMPAAGEEFDQLLKEVSDKVSEKLTDALQIRDKQQRSTAIGELKDQLVEQYCPPDQEDPTYESSEVSRAFEQVQCRVFRELILQGNRSDGRGPEEIRDITCQVSFLPRTHGSAVFTRGQTQALVTTTLGTTRDEQIVDGLAEEYRKKFMLHYNFPPFSVGEVRRIFGPGRREIGHGALAERCLEAVLPSIEKFPYTIRLVSDILESNGSSSMASVCGGTLSLMDAGVPISAPIAGISIGLIKDADKEVLLTDIIGDEDHYGDMDFKVAGTQRGITGIQLDLKADGLSYELIIQALDRARKARMEILKTMLECIDAPRPEISEHAPKLLTIKIHPDKIGKVIGPGGKVIKKLQEQTGATIEIEDDGTVYISCVDGDGAELARKEIELITAEVVIGKVYTGKVISIKDFGAFIEVLPGQDGLCHISELSDQYVQNVEDVCKYGDQIEVKVLSIDNQGRVKLSRKAVLEEQAPSGTAK